VWPRRRHFNVVHGQVSIQVLDWIHLFAAYILGGDSPRLVQEGDLVVYALGDQVCVLLARGVEEVEFLAPIALALRLEAIVTRRLGFVTLQMPFPASQAPGTRSLGLVVRCGIASPLLGRQRLGSGRAIV
jgi:hypothetical protein